MTYRKSSIKPPGVGSIWGVVGGAHGRLETGGLFSLEMMMVSVLHKELEYKVEKLKSESFRSSSRGSESNPNFQLVNEPSRISPHKVLWSWLINTDYHLLLKNN